MGRIRPLVMVLVVTLGVGCGAEPAPPGGTRAVPSTAPSSTALSSTARSSTVFFSPVDGARLTGRLFGAGATGVVLSNMGDNDPAAWEGFAPALADRGLLVLTYSFRYPLRTDAFTPAMARGTVADLTAAVDYLRR